MKISRRLQSRFLEKAQLADPAPLCIKRVPGASSIVGQRRFQGHVKRLLFAAIGRA